MLKNKTILITGASSGIGKATAIYCASLGARCVITGRDNERLQSTLSQLSGQEHIAFAFDLTNETDLHKIVNSVPPLDGISHCAGIIQLLPSRMISATTFDKIIKVNVYAPFFLTQHLLKQKKITAGASIVFVSSISGNVIGAKGNLMYSASKSAVNGMTKVLALELAEKKIRVNTISAGMVRSEMWLNDNMVVSEEQLKKDEENYPLGYGEPIDVANIIGFLLSDGSKWITGSNIVADGGFTIK